MLSEQYNLNDPEERTSFHNETAKRLAQIEEVLERNNYIEAVSNLYHIDKAGLTDLVHKYGIAGVPRSEIVEREERRAEHESRAADPAKNKPMKLLLTWMVNEPGLFQKLDGIIDETCFEDGVYRVVADKLYSQYRENGRVELIASAQLKSAYKKYEKVSTRSGFTAEQVAAMILRNAGITDVTIRPIAGDLTDNYNPKDHTLNLSQNVYGSRSIAAIGVAAHECGHAIQHAEGYAPLGFRSAIVPVVSIGSTLSWPLIQIGLLIPRLDVCITLGILLFSLVVVFQFVTLPVEFNASGRAIAILRNGGFMTEEELGGAKRVLTAAALTYVAAMVTAILQLVRLLLLTNRRR